MPVKTDSIKHKGVHLRMDKATHKAFKVKLAELDVSMQEALEEFARLVGSGNLTCVGILERLLRNKVKEELATVGLKPSKRKRKRLIELDVDGLYDLINETEKNVDVLPFVGELR